MFRTNEYCIEGEVWKDIPTYENLYQASTLGRIRGIEGRVTFSKHHGKRVWKGRILKNKTKQMRKEGYKVSLYKDGVVKDWLVARLVCMAFHGNVDHNLPVKDKMTVNHKDGNRSNNKPTNIEWLTIKENIQHAFKTGLMKNSQNGIVIDLDNGFCKRFDSMAEASRYLGKQSGYVSNSIKKGHKLFDKENKQVFVFHIN